MLDSPSSYSGQAGLCVKVKGTEDGLEFGVCGGGGGEGDKWVDTGTFIEPNSTFADNIRVTAIQARNWSNATLTESQITDLSHTVDTDTQKTTSGSYLYNDTSVIYFNGTLLNATIDSRAGGGGGGGGTNDSIFFNKTSFTTDANFSTLVSTGETGYEAGNLVCSSNFTGTHLCDWNEIKRTYDLKDVSTITAFTGTAWVAGGPSKYSGVGVKFVNDCNGFTDASGSDSFGNAWDFTNNKGLTGNCGSTIPIACCKAW